MITAIIITYLAVVAVMFTWAWIGRCKPKNVVG